MEMRQLETEMARETETKDLDEKRTREAAEACAERERQSLDLANARLASAETCGKVAQLVGEHLKIAQESGIQISRYGPPFFFFVLLE
jgi:hypothetical protein